MAVACWLLPFILLIFPTPALASTCRQIEGKEICLVEIKRSAKNYWEYRAIVSINDKIQPLEVYNCRDRLKIASNGTLSPFRENDFSDLVCKLYKRP